MNRTILIVICDFLLVSLLTFSAGNINKTPDLSAARSMTTMGAPAVTNGGGSRQDLGEVMQLALEEERKKQDALTLELTQARQTSSAQLQAAREQLRARDEQLRAREQEAARLQEQQTNLVQQMAMAQGDVARLNQKLQAASTEVVLTKEERLAQEAEARKLREEAAALQHRLASLESSNQAAATQRAQLMSQLQLSETQREAAAAQLARTEEDLNVQRQENVKLSEGVKALAGKSSELAQEIRENRPLAPNAIFDQLATNRVTLSFFGVRPGLFGGDSTKYKQTQTILVTDGVHTYALCHLQDTLLTLWDPGTAWEEMTGTVAHGPSVEAMDSLSFYLLDPRIALMPVSPEAAKALNCHIYRLAQDPFKFQDAVVVGAREGYYGECQFQMDLSTPQYLKMDRNSLKGLFGKFNPSTGDLVFSRTGDLLGIMANNTYCIIVKNFDTVASVRFGTDTRSQPIASTLASLYSTVTTLPFKLQ